MRRNGSRGLKVKVNKNYNSNIYDAEIIIKELGLICSLFKAIISEQVIPALGDEAASALEYQP